MTNFEKSDLDQRTASYREDFTPDVEKGLNHLHARMAERSESRSTSFKSSARRSLLRYAAVGALLLIAGLSYLRLNNFGGQTYVTNAETQEITLPDGTEVLLNQYSQLSYNSSYGDVERAINLEGEAFFSVVPNAEQPFMVRQDDVELRVVGTSFNLQAKPGNKFFEVEVATGKVSLKAGEEEIMVNAKQCGLFKSASGLQLMDAPHLNRHAWRTKELVFDALPFSEVISIINRAYNINIRVERINEEVCDFPVTATYANVTLEEILIDLERFTGGKFIQDETTGIYQLKNWCDAPKG